MSDTFNLITFPLEFKTLSLILKYRGDSLNPLDKGARKTRVLVKLPLEFEVTKLATAASSPTVSTLVLEIKKLILSRILPLLGKNVQIQSLFIKTEVFQISIPLYEFGKGERPAVPFEHSLFFSLQSFGSSTDYRFYLKGFSSALLKPPLSETDLQHVKEFEDLFTQPMSFFDKSIALQYVKNEKKIISCIFRESIHFQKRPSPKKKLSLLQVRKKVKKKKLVMA